MAKSVQLNKKDDWNYTNKQVILGFFKSVVRFYESPLNYNTSVNTYSI